MPRLRLALLGGVVSMALALSVLASASDSSNVLAATALHDPARASAHGHAAVSAQDLYGTPLEAAVAGVLLDLGDAYPNLPPPSYPCPSSLDGYTGQCIDFQTTLLGTNAAVIVGGTSVCSDSSEFTFRCGDSSGLVAYVVHETDGWRYLDAITSQNGGAPHVWPAAVISEAIDANDIFVRTPGDCANVRSTPSLDATILDCLNDQTWVRLDDGPVYVGGRIWWHLAGRLSNGPLTPYVPAPRGWIAHEVIGWPRLAERAR